jgi:hypothetical protein
VSWRPKHEAAQVDDRRPHRACYGATAAAASGGRDNPDRNQSEGDGRGSRHCTALVMNSTIHKRDEIGSSVQEKLKFGKSSVKLLRLFTMFLSACAAVLLQSIIYSRCLTAVTTDSHINGLFPSCFDLSRSTRQAGP